MTLFGVRNTHDFQVLFRDMACIWILKPDEAIGFEAAPLACILPALVPCTQDLKPSMGACTQDLAVIIHHSNCDTRYSLTDRTRFIRDLMNFAVRLDKIRG